MIKIDTASAAARKQAALAHIKHLDTQIQKLQDLAIAYDKDAGECLAVAALDDIRNGAKRLRELFSSGAK